ncbi:MAG TPA: response regulator [Verrucomicrobiae bacterium]|nr:response regulator [Verrucomicrobiae bacterium]
MRNHDVILHIEDDANDVELVQMAFRKAKADCRLMVVNDGDDAISYLKGEGAFADRAVHPLPAVILLDVKLPRRSGLEVLEWIRSNAELPLRRVPVLMLTSSNQPMDVARAYDLGANSYLVKPADLGVLTELMKTIAAYWLEFNMPSNG